MRAIAQEAHELAERVDELHESIDTQNKRNAFKIKVMASVVVLLVILVAGFGWVARRDHELRSGVLCPMYRVWLGSYQPETRTPGPDREKYEQTFTEMRKQYAVLQCIGDLVPPRSDLVTKPAK